MSPSLPAPPSPSPIESGGGLAGWLVGLLTGGLALALLLGPPPVLWPLPEPATLVALVRQPVMAGDLPPLRTLAGVAVWLAWFFWSWLTLSVLLSLFERFAERRCRPLSPLAQALAVRLAAPIVRQGIGGRLALTQVTTSLLRPPTTDAAPLLHELTPLPTPPRSGGQVMMSDGVETAALVTPALPPVTEPADRQAVLADRQPVLATLCTGAAPRPAGDEPGGTGSPATRPGASTGAAPCGDGVDGPTDLGDLPDLLAELGLSGPITTSVARSHASGYTAPTWREAEATTTWPCATGADGSWPVDDWTAVAQATTTPPCATGADGSWPADDWAAVAQALDPGQRPQATVCDTTPAEISPELTGDPRTSSNPPHNTPPTPAPVEPAALRPAATSAAPARPGQPTPNPPTTHPPEPTVPTAPPSDPAVATALAAAEAAIGQPLTPAPEAIVLTLLGPAWFTRGPRRRELTRPKMVELLTYLALHPEGVIKETIAQAIWPETDTTHRQLNALDKTRQRLIELMREVLDDPLVEPLSGQEPRTPYRLHIPGLWVDVRVVATALAYARSLTDEAAAAAVIRATLGLCRGRLGNEAGWLWLEERAEYLAQEIVHASQRLTRYDTQRGDYRAAILVYARLDHRLKAGDERLICEELTCYAALGDEHSLRQAWVEYTTWLDHELELEPEPATLAHYTALVRQFEITRTPPPPRDHQLSERLASEALGRCQPVAAATGGASPV